MLVLSGIDCTFPYANMHLVGALLFVEYPSTVVFADENRSPIIKEWVDCSDDNTVDRFFYYRTDKLILKKFIEGKIPHLEMINSSLEEFVIFQDISNEKVLQTCVVSLKLIPQDYKPVNDFYFTPEDSLDAATVYDFFDLGAVVLEGLDKRIAKDMSKTYNSETLYFHLNKGRGIGYGTINIEIFARTLSTFDKLYKNVALDFFKGVNRGDIQLDAQKNSELLKYTSTELYGERIAASYGFLIRPQNPQIGLFDRTSETEDIANRIFELVESSKNGDTLNLQYSNYSGFTLQSYRFFLESINRFQLSFDLSWFNPLNNKERTNTLDYRSAITIIENIDRLTTTGRSEFTVNGKFRAVNCDTRHYTFTSLNDQQYSGYFDKAIKEAAESVNFIDVYEIRISRMITKDPAKTEDIIKDTIISCYRESVSDNIDEVL